MERILLTAVVAVGALFLGLTVLIVVTKAWREGRDRWRAARRRELEPRILRWVHGDGTSLQVALGGVTRGERTVVEGVLLDHVQRVRGVERDRLARALDELGCVERYRHGLQSGRWWTRAASAEKLGMAGAVRAARDLATMLEDPVPEVRIRAAAALGAMGGEAAVRPLILALDEPSRWSTIRIADILTGMGQPVLEELVGVFPRMTVQGKLAAIDILGRVRSVEVVDWLRARLLNDHRDVRARACHALGAIGDADSAPAVAQMLRDPEWPVRAMAAKALGRLRYQGAIPGLALAVRDPEWWVRANAAEALRRMGEPGLAALEALLDDPDNFARHQAVLMLQEAGVVDQRIEALAGPDGPERRRAESLVAKLAATGHVGRLRELEVVHPDPAVRRALSLLRERAAEPAGVPS
jgi:HEAT repeat protein